MTISKVPQVGSHMLELIKTGGLSAVAVVSAVLAYDFLDQRYYGMKEIIVAALAVGLAAVTGLPARKSKVPICQSGNLGVSEHA